jgi:hypothetical protein
MPTIRRQTVRRDAHANLLMGFSENSSNAE